MTHKNPAFALEVAKECISRDSDVRLVMVGDGEAKRREFQGLVNEWGLGRKIEFLGLRSDVPRLMLGANMLLFPSLAEGLGMVVVEAQAAGLPVLASDTTPRECVVVPGLVDFMSLAETPGLWAERALSLLNRDPTNPDTCNAAVRDSSFSIERSAAKLLSIYHPDQTTCT
jgi:glycosyltransferase involved in cell wall biosynthesis